MAVATLDPVAALKAELHDRVDRVEDVGALLNLLDAIDAALRAQRGEVTDE